MYIYIRVLFELSFGYFGLTINMQSRLQSKFQNIFTFLLHDFDIQFYLCMRWIISDIRSYIYRLMLVLHTQPCTKCTVLVLHTTQYLINSQRQNSRIPLKLTMPDHHKMPSARDDLFICLAILTVSRTLRNFTDRGMETCTITFFIAHSENALEAETCT